LDWDLSTSHVYASFEDKLTDGTEGYMLAKITFGGDVKWNKWYNMG